MRYGKQIERLFENQHKMFLDAVKVKKNKIALFEAPTGFGKSVIVNSVAEALAEESKKIIIAVPTNHLGIELYDLFKNKNSHIAVPFNEELMVDVVFGYENYFDINNFNMSVYEYINREQVENYLKKVEENGDSFGYLIESLFENIDIEEPNKPIVSAMINCKKKKEFMKSFDELDISITSYANLFVHCFYKKDFDVSDYVIIADEVHQMVEVAENLLTNSFSLYRFRNLYSQLKEELNKEGLLNKKLDLLVNEQIYSLNSLLNTYSKEEAAGNFYKVSLSESSSFENNILNGIKNEMLKPIKTGKGDNEKTDTITNIISSQIEKKVKSTQSKQLSLIYGLYKKEKAEMLATLRTPEAVTVYLSPSKGYPTLNSSKGDVRGYLLNYFFDKVQSFIGVSATILTSNEDKAAFARLGLNRSTLETWQNMLENVKAFKMQHKRFPTEDDNEICPKCHLFIESQRKGYEEGWLSTQKENMITDALGESFFYGIPRGEKTISADKTKPEIEKYGVITQGTVFSKEQAKTYLVSPNFVTPPSITEDDNIQTEWFDKIANIVAKNHNNENCLVLCGSFFEAEMLAKKIEILTRQDNVNIIKAERNKPAAQLITRFKNEGGILIGTRNYGTGVNLPNTQLTKLFITKLPFPIYNTKKWLDIKDKDEQNNTSFFYKTYLDEMFIAFRQWIGRLIRTKNDIGELYLLDSRLHDSKYKKTITYWIERMSEISGEYLDKNDEVFVPIVDYDKSLVLRDKIAGIDCDEDIKDYLIKNIDFILQKNKLPNIPSEKDGYNKVFGIKYNKFKKNYKWD